MSLASLKESETIVRMGRPQRRLTYAAVSCVLAWWVYDLHFHWNSTPEYQFGWIVLMLTGYLVWEKWPQRPLGDQPASIWWVLLLVLLGTPLLAAGGLYEQAVARSAAATLSISMGCCLFAAALLLAGAGQATLRHFLFPLLFLFVAVPLPQIIWNPIVLGLQKFVTAVTVEALIVMGVPAQATGNVIQLPNALVGVDQACSGIRSLQSSIFAALFIGYLAVRGVSLRLLLVLIGIALAIAGNLTRAFYLSWMAAARGTDVLQQVHDTAGWGVLAFTAAGLGLASWLFSRLKRDGGRAV